MSIALGGHGQDGAAGLWSWPLRRGWGLAWFAAIVTSLAVTLFMPAPGPVSKGIADLAFAPASASTWLPPPQAWSGGAPVEARGPAVWVRGRFILSDADANQGSAALVASGPFSARVWVNGIFVGAKGEPGLTAAQEQVGPIDAALPVGRAARPGRNDFLMLVSAHAAGSAAGSIFHGLSIEAHGADPRRPLGRYFVALTQSGLLLAIAAAFGFVALRRRSGPIGWAAVAAIFLMIALAAETLRCWVNYPYDLHFVRMSTVWAALTGFGAAVFGAACARSGSRLTWPVIGVVMALNLATLGFSGAGDDRMTLLLALGPFGIGAALLSWPAARAGDRAAQVLVAVIVAWLAAAAIRPGMFVDNGVYLFGTVTLLAFGWTPAARGGSGAEIVAVRAQGNYVEMRTADGKKALVRQALSQFPVTGAMVRVHRSWLVNLRHARRVVAKTGSRYQLELNDGSTIPVSRAMAAVLRERLRVTRTPERRAAPS